MRTLAATPACDTAALQRALQYAGQGQGQGCAVHGLSCPDEDQHISAVQFHCCACRFQGLMLHCWRAKPSKVKDILQTDHAGKQA